MSLQKSIFKSFCLPTVIIFIVNAVVPVELAAQVQLSAISPQPSALMSEGGRLSAVLRGMTIDVKDPLMFEFIIADSDQRLANSKDEKNNPSRYTLNANRFENESMRLIHYFLAALTTPEDQLWVNLSPDEPDRILPHVLGRTQIGRDLIGQDYLLKQLTASLLQPEDETGKKFWDAVYEEARQQGIIDIPVDLQQKVWIVPDVAKVAVRNNSVFITEARMKVMTEEEYSAISDQRLANSKNHNDSNRYPLSAKRSDIQEEIRRIILPVIEKEINEGERFAPLRQMHQAMILASWYKKNLKQSLLGQSYVNQQKTDGLNTVDAGVKDHLYEQYLDLFRNGMNRMIKEEYDPETQSVTTKQYISGGYSAATLDVAADEASLAKLKEIVLDTQTVKFALQTSDPSAVKTDLAMLVDKFLPVDEVIFYDSSSFMIQMPWAELWPALQSSDDLNQLIDAFDAVRLRKKQPNAPIWLVCAVDPLSSQEILHQNANSVDPEVWDKLGQAGVVWLRAGYLKDDRDIREAYAESIGKDGNVFSSQISLSGIYDWTSPKMSLNDSIEQMRRNRVVLRPGIASFSRLFWKWITTGSPSEKWNYYEGDDYYNVYVLGKEIQDKPQKEITFTERNIKTTVPGFVQERMRLAGFVERLTMEKDSRINFLPMKKKISFKHYSKGFEMIENAFFKHSNVLKFLGYELDGALENDFENIINRKDVPMSSYMVLWVIAQLLQAQVREGIVPVLEHRENLEDWTSRSISADDLAGEMTLSTGSEAAARVVVFGENLLIFDAGKKYQLPEGEHLQLSSRSLEILWEQGNIVLRDLRPSSHMDFHYTLSMSVSERVLERNNSLLLGGLAAYEAEQTINVSAVVSPYGRILNFEGRSGRWDKFYGDLLLKLAYDPASQEFSILPDDGQQIPQALQTSIEQWNASVSGSDNAMLSSAEMLKEVAEWNLDPVYQPAETVMKKKDFRKTMLQIIKKIHPKHPSDKSFWYDADEDTFKYLLGYVLDTAHKWSKKDFNFVRAKLDEVEPFFLARIHKKNPKIVRLLPTVDDWILYASAAINKEFIERILSLIRFPVVLSVAHLRLIGRHLRYRAVGPEGDDEEDVLAAVILIKKIEPYLKVVLDELKNNSSSFDHEDLKNKARIMLEAILDAVTFFWEQKSPKKDRRFLQRQEKWMLEFWDDHFSKDPRVKKTIARGLRVFSKLKKIKRDSPLGPWHSQAFSGYGDQDMMKMDPSRSARGRLLTGEYGERNVVRWKADRFFSVYRMVIKFFESDNAMLSSQEMLKEVEAMVLVPRNIKSLRKSPERLMESLTLSIQNTVHDLFPGDVDMRTFVDPYSFFDIVPRQKDIARLPEVMSQLLAKSMDDPDINEDQRKGLAKISVDIEQNILHQLYLKQQAGGMAAFMSFMDDWKVWHASKDADEKIFKQRSLNLLDSSLPEALAHLILFGQHLRVAATEEDVADFDLIPAYINKVVSYLQVVLDRLDEWNGQNLSDTNEYRDLSQKAWIMASAVIGATTFIRTRAKDFDRLVQTDQEYLSKHTAFLLKIQNEMENFESAQKTMGRAIDRFEDDFRNGDPEFTGIRPWTYRPLRPYAADMIIDAGNKIKGYTFRQLFWTQEGYPVLKDHGLFKEYGDDYVRVIKKIYPRTLGFWKPSSESKTNRDAAMMVDLSLEQGLKADSVFNGKLSTKQQQRLLEVLAMDDDPPLPDPVDTSEKSAWEQAKDKAQEIFVLLNRPAVAQLWVDNDLEHLNLAREILDHIHETPEFKKDRVKFMAKFKPLLKEFERAYWTYLRDVNSKRAEFFRNMDDVIFHVSMEYMKPSGFKRRVKNSLLFGLEIIVMHLKYTGLHLRNDMAFRIEKNSQKIVGTDVVDIKSTREMVDSLVPYLEVLLKYLDYQKDSGKPFVVALDKRAQMIVESIQSATVFVPDSSGSIPETNQETSLAYFSQILHGMFSLRAKDVMQKLLKRYPAFRIFDENSFLGFYANDGYGYEDLGGMFANAAPGRHLRAILLTLGTGSSSAFQKLSKLETKFVIRVFGVWVKFLESPSKIAGDAAMMDIEDAIKIAVILMILSARLPEAQAQTGQIEQFEREAHQFDEEYHTWAKLNLMAVHQVLDIVYPKLIFREDAADSTGVREYRFFKDDGAGNLELFYSMVIRPFGFEVLSFGVANDEHQRFVDSIIPVLKNLFGEAERRTLDVSRPQDTQLLLKTVFFTTAYKTPQPQSIKVVLFDGSSQADSLDLPYIVTSSLQEYMDVLLPQLKVFGVDGFSDVTVNLGVSGVDEMQSYTEEWMQTFISPKMLILVHFNQAMMSVLQNLTPEQLIGLIGQDKVFESFLERDKRKFLEIFTIDENPPLPAQRLDASETTALEQAKTEAKVKAEAILNLIGQTMPRSFKSHDPYEFGDIILDHIHEAKNLDKDRLKSLLKEYERAVWMLGFENAERYRNMQDILFYLSTEEREDDKQFKRRVINSLLFGPEIALMHLKYMGLHWRYEMSYRIYASGKAAGQDIADVPVTRIMLYFLAPYLRVLLKYLNNSKSSDSLVAKAVDRRMQQMIQSIQSATVVIPDSHHEDVNVDPKESLFYLSLMLEKIFKGPAKSPINLLMQKALGKYPDFLRFENNKFLKLRAGQVYGSFDFDSIFDELASDELESTDNVHLRTILLSLESNPSRFFPSVNEKKLPFVEDAFGVWTAFFKVPDGSLADAAVMDQSDRTKGGIDLNASQMNLQEEGAPLTLDLPSADPAQLRNINGFVPVILSIRPTDVKVLLALP